jgi:hypothetical protein
VKNLFGRPVSHYLLSAGFAASACAFLVTAWGYPQDARAFPAAIAIALLAFTALDLIALTNTAVGSAVRRVLNPTIKADASAGPVWRQAAAGLSLLGIVAALVLLGIEVAVPLYLFVSLRFRARRSWASTLMITAAVSVALWLLFVAALRLDLYRGYLLTRFLPAG